ncbi:hypothetical protein [Kocuria sp.]|uniref:hypothetical protein n=1 Tax=Kocuria sp. TaxID=1871328 RepID=UPI0026DFCF89|nr:hypothetical protein [Kocuria sp.]MDO5618846.1 hypothetical protein [Kocuria sp.]
MARLKTTLSATLTAGLLLSSGWLLTACGSDRSQEISNTATESFPADGEHLTINNEFGRLDVRHTDTDVITVEREVTTAGRTPSEPNWDLTDSTLTLSSACGEGYVGLCEPSYTVTVPTGTQVKVLG